MSVHYKFKNHLDHDFITFDGLYISVGDLRRSIIEKKKIGKGSDIFLEITNAQTKEVYDDDKVLIPKNTAVLVARIPLEGGLKKSRLRITNDQLMPTNNVQDNSAISYDKILKSADLLNSKISETDKVKEMITQSGFEYDPSKYKKACKPAGMPPHTYKCYRCGNGGHWINNCPTNDPNIKRSTGIPRSFMIQVDGPEHRGALLTNSGSYAVPKVHHQAYQSEKKEKPPFIPQEESTPNQTIPKISEEMLCLICKEILQDSVTTPCCGNSFCDECIRQALVDSDEHECPVCLKIDVSPNDLVPNLRLRRAVVNFKNKYSQLKRSIYNEPSFVSKKNPSPHCSPDSTVEIQPQEEEATNQRNLINIRLPIVTNIYNKVSTPEIIDSENSQDVLQSAEEPSNNEFSQEQCNIGKSYTVRSDGNIKENKKEAHLEVLPIRTIGTVNYTHRKYKIRDDPHLKHYSNRYSHHGKQVSTYFEDNYHNLAHDYEEKSDRKDSLSRTSRHRHYTRKTHNSGDSFCKDDYLFKHGKRLETSSHTSTAYDPAIPHHFVCPPVSMPYSSTQQPLSTGESFMDQSLLTAQPLPPVVDPVSSYPYRCNTLSDAFKSYEERNVDYHHTRAYQRNIVRHDENPNKSHRRTHQRSCSPLSHHRSHSQSRSSSDSWSSASSFTSLFSSRSRSDSYSRSRSFSRSSERGKKHPSYPRSRSCSRFRSYTKSRSRSRSKYRSTSGTNSRENRHIRKQKDSHNKLSRSCCSSRSKYTYTEIKQLNANEKTHKRRKCRSRERQRRKVAVSNVRSRSRSYSKKELCSTSHKSESRKKQSSISTKKVSKHKRNSKHKSSRIRPKNKESKTNKEISVHIAPATEVECKEELLDKQPNDSTKSFEHDSDASNSLDREYEVFSDVKENLKKKYKHKKKKHKSKKIRSVIVQK